MTTFHENPALPGGLLLSSAGRSRELVTLAASQATVSGTLLARKTVLADVVATASAGADNTPSSGTIEMAAPALTDKVKDGRYTGVALTATEVHWSDPDGVQIGVSTHGTVFTKGGISLTITAGSEPNVPGDVYYVDVAADSEDFRFVAFDPDGADGSEIPFAVAINRVTTPADATARIQAIVRDAEIIGSGIEWPAGITAAAKADAIQALAAKGIIIRA